MININLTENPIYYFDYRQGLNLLKELNYDDYQYPEEIVNFHVYSEVKNEKELLCIESYLATQNLEKTKLILWSDYDISDNPLIQPYKHLIDMRVYDVREESNGTVLEGNERWFSAQDSKHYMKSGILRFLVTHKYGGIWADMDMIFLRDFKPILDQEWAYMWGGETDFYRFGPCAAMMNLKKRSDHSNVCMNEILKTPVMPDTTALDHMLLAKVYSIRRFDVFPSTFFNVEWLMSKVDKKLSDDILTYWFENPCPENLLFIECFAWHWHNSSNKNKNVVTGSKFDLLTKRTKKLLKERGILEKENV